MNVIKLIWDLVLRFSGVLVLLWQKRRKFNSWMERRYTPRIMALIGTGACLAVAVYALFVGPYLGVANDSIGNRKMQEYGLSYLEADRGEDEAAFASNEYFTREYGVGQSEAPIHSSQNLFVHLAMGLDTLFTQDALFDVRFLALIYLLLYLPAVYLVLKAGVERVSYFSEAVTVTVLGVLIFAEAG